jgi:hypothetical protein
VPQDLLRAALANLQMETDPDCFLLLETRGAGVQPIPWTLDSAGAVSGDRLIVLKKSPILTVHFVHASPLQVRVDISLKTKAVLECVCRSVGICNYFCYQLMTMDDSILDPEKLIPQQISVLHELKCVRHFFLLTREDIATLDAARIVFFEAMHEFRRNGIYLSEDQTVEIVALYCIASCDRAGGVDTSAIDEDAFRCLPVTCVAGKKMIGKVRAWVRSNLEALDQFTAIRRLLKILRRLQGFGSKNFESHLVEVKARGAKHRTYMRVQVGPQCLRFINPLTRVLEERISYTKIVSLAVLGECLQIQFSVSAGDAIYKYKVIGPGAPRMKALIDPYRRIAHEIELRRARERAQRHGGSVLGVVCERSRLHLFTTADVADRSPRRFTYDCNFTGRMLLQAVEQNLGVAPDHRHVLLVRMTETLFRWVADDHILRLIYIQNGMTVYLLTNFEPLSIQFADGHTDRIPLDITKNIEDLAAPIFEYEALPHITGYTLYLHENAAAPRPLDTRSSLPEQCRNWSRLLFKRRFWVISGLSLANPIVAHSTVCDCRDHILSGATAVTEDQALTLAVLALYATNPQTADLRHARIELADHVPAGMKVTKKLQKKFKEVLSTTPPMEKFVAAKCYLGRVRRVDGFGAESFKVLYTDISFGTTVKPIRDVTVFVGPFSAYFTHASKQIEAIPYKKLESFETMGQHIVLRYVSKAKKIVTIDLKSKDIGTVHMLITYNIKIIRDLMIAKERSQEQL